MSPENYERQRPVAEIADDFDAYAGEQVARFNGLSDFLTDSLPVVEDLEKCNAALAEAGRPDLAMTGHVDMLRVDSPDELQTAGANFTANFIMYKDRIDSPADSHEPPTFIPLSKDDIRNLSRLPKIASREDWEKLKESGKFVLPFNATHVGKAALTRMLVLFPDFTIDLISKISSAKDDVAAETRMEAELFVAYKLMSRLVDKNDDNGEPISSWYLYI